MPCLAGFFLVLYHTTHYFSGSGDTFFSMFLFLNRHLFFFKEFIYVFLERGEGREEERERNISQLPPVHALA